MRTLIVDDEPLARHMVRRLLGREPDVEIVGECDDGPAAVRRLAGGDVDLVLLDINMPGGAGFEVLRDLAPAHAPMVILVTAHDEHAVRAFEAEALDYLLKPIDDERFATAVARARRRLGLVDANRLSERVGALVSHLESAARRDRTIRLRCAGRLVHLRESSIDWVESADYCVRVHAGAETHVVRQTMADLERRLDPARFVRIHRSCIICVDRVREIQPLYHGDFLVVLEDGGRHRVSRTRRTNLERLVGPLL